MNIFRKLNKKEEQEFKQWARDNYIPGTKVNEVYHPVVQQECDLINREIAYAKLISAAPALLDALELIKGIANDETDAPSVRFNAISSKAVEAINKTK
tara:strand:+ start:599 stop:892 length:294 start_codon:yes stop_codon:yes gene_type:complete